MTLGLAPRGPFQNALRWAGLSFAVASVVGASAIVPCMQRLCLAQAPFWLGKLAASYLVLSAPWVLLFDFGPSRSAWVAVRVAIAAAASIALIVGVLRYWFLRLRAFLAAPLPELADGAIESEHAPEPAPRMMLLAFALTLFFVVVGGFVRQGAPSGSLMQHVLVLSSVLALACIPFYFEVRRSRRANKLEIALAFSWVVLRRLILLTFAVPLVVYAIASFRNGELGMAAATLLFACVVAWWGWFGAGYRRAFEDDLPTHNARKRRYGWK